MTNVEMITQMYHLQDTFNQKLFPDWETRGLRWKDAILAEAGEAIGSFSYKWWKHGTDDYENYKVELVDIWHFVMSADMEDLFMLVKDGDLTTEIKEAIPDRDFSLYCKDMFDDIEFPKFISKEKKFCLNQTHEIPKALYSCDPFELVLTLLYAWTRTVGTIDELFKLYIGKNVLNVFRSDHGYKDGTYKKVWDGKEDNVVMMELLEQMECTPEMFRDLLDRLEIVYATV
jgi:hypothetical protein